MQAIFAQTIRAKHMYPGGAGRTERGVGGGQREVWEGGQRGVWGEGAGAQLTVLLSIYLS
jgi:hypothetical protein